MARKGSSVRTVLGSRRTRIGLIVAVPAAGVGAAFVYLLDRNQGRRRRRRARKRTKRYARAVGRRVRRVTRRGEEGRPAPEPVATADPGSPPGPDSEVSPAP